MRKKSFIQSVSVALFSISIIALFFSCNTQLKPKKKQNKKATTTKSENKVTIGINISPNKNLKIADKLYIDISHKQKTNPDSVIVYLNNKKLSICEFPTKIETGNCKTGKQKIKIVAHWPNQVLGIANKSFILLSDIVPDQYSYRVIKTWPHSTSAYTQGLEFNNSYLYEGTGHYGESMLSILDLEKGETIQSINLDKEVFGEGITILNDKIYQLTWKSSIGFVYNKNSLQKLYEFNYPTDGWGLTNNGSELIMSDGSEKIYFLDAEYFTENSRIEVYDNLGSVNNLNELEYIDGYIYANVYTTNNIVVIDPKTGKIVKTINLTGILKKEEIKKRVDVLNGIAWDATNKRLVVTGKWWPKLYQIELVKTN